MASKSDQDWRLTKKTVLERNCHMFNNPFMSDITFTCGESRQKKFYAHKYVLATSSPVFYPMFYGDLAEKNSVIHLKHADEESFEEFLRFLYTYECTLTWQIAVRVIHLADYYNVPRLVEKCISILKISLNAENVFTILESIQCEEKEQLQKECWEIVCSQTYEAVTSDNFNDASKQTVDNLLKQDTLDIKEIELFKAVLKWGDHECSRKGLEATGENKRAILGESVHEIRFLSMTQEEFAQNVSTSGVLTSEEVVSIYDKFSGKEVPSFQWKLEKRKLYLHRCSRYKKKLANISAFPGWPLFHGLRFSVSQPVVFHGVRLFGCKEGPKINNFMLNSKEVKVNLTNYSEKDVDALPSGFDVMLPTPTPVKQNEEVRIVTELDHSHGQPYCGEHDQTSVTTNGVNVTFSNVKGGRNKTILKSGPFHQILFTKQFN